MAGLNLTGAPVGKIGCVAIVKNEERHIAEWLAWQFFVGFDTVFLFNNESTDRTRAVAAGFAPRYDVRVLDWPGGGQGFQARAYEHAIRLLKDEFEWLAFFDADEFLVLDEGLDLKGLLAQRQEAAIGIPWAIFGSSGHIDYPKELVIEAFTRRAPAAFPPNAHIKSIVRPRAVKRAYNPHAFEIDAEYVDLKGRKLTFKHPGVLAETAEYDGVKLHHYFTRSWAHWQARLTRGNLGTPRTEQDFHNYDRNEVSDCEAARRVPQVRAILKSLEQEAGPCLGIAVTTFNRKDMVLKLVAALRVMTSCPFDLVICDDGSHDGTAAALRERGEIVIAGENRGVAWNKNRGLYYLMATKAVDIVMLLDDDMFPMAEGWEREWVEAARRHGHVNYATSGSDMQAVTGDMTPENPGLTPSVSGCLLAFDRRVLAQIGFMDLRFKRYGHEHAEFTARAIRAGYGGILLEEAGRERYLYKRIRGQMALLPVAGSGCEEAIRENGVIYAQIAKDQIYRHAWRDDEEMAAFLAEQEAAVPLEKRPLLRSINRFSSIEAYERARAAGEIGVLPGRVAQRDLSGASSKLVFDIGMAEGDDTALYLAKGFRVVGLEPDVKTYYGLCERFAAEIKDGRLTVLNYAAGRETGQIVEFFHNDRHPRLSGFSAGRPEFASGFTSYHVVTIGWAELVAEYGVPHYAKIDIEGVEVAFLAGAEGAVLPAYISVECHDLGPAEALYRLGYRRFQLSDQNPPGGYAWPDPPREGCRAKDVDVNYTSGPFGAELPPDWLDFRAFCAAWHAAKAQGKATWYDCHAAMK